jgi:hypothetical protein
MTEPTCGVCGKALHSKEEDDLVPGHPIQAALRQLLAERLVVKVGRRLSADGRCKPIYAAVARS